MNIAILIGVGFWGVVAGALVLPALRSPTERQIRDLAFVFSVPVTSPAVPVAVDVVRAARRARLLGGAIAAVTWWLWSGDSHPFNIVAIATGVAVGGLVAEATRRPIRSDTMRVASTDVRTVGDHMPRSVLACCATVWLLLAVAVVLAVAVQLPHPDVTDAARELSLNDRMLAVTALFLSAMVFPVGRAIARRPAPQDDPDVARVMHRLRTASLWSVLGGGLVIAGAGAYLVVFEVVLADSQMNAAVRHANNAAYGLSVAAMVVGLVVVFRAFPHRAGARQAAPS